ncbi:UbiX family flavin prenyltransferase [Mycolicibacterium wolinskyi]|uniref:Flavin prenyltransferase UbiX n=1 Tax=Mycolicibacterium wolinskyi TaxID=59750 RepID=A0A1X2F2B4_9MYCO|nr:MULTISPECIES: UbiX family flavin prenyltransferase [Mycolicibacterium]MCV7287632.1 UbiX family flavin prenyltransferase [Mycolicibacterium wolinskyi]MCV7294530.1 UbiX family flavin prenyltransferase [Mycolicibacterium goodii]ORX12580.1 phenolic acid decarboxylase subunit B [Mycolicibacterium wolinskyi]
MTAGRRRRVIVGITGASGSILGIRMLERLRELDIETHLIMSAWGARTIEHETTWTAAEVRQLADFTHKPGDLGACVSSGSFHTDGMLVAPCSMKTLAAIACGYTEDLVARAADVVLKERRRLVLLAREAPLSEIHLENMLKLARMGVSIVPPVPAFYNRPKTLDEVVDYIVTRALDQVGIIADESPRWDGNMTKQRP